MEKHSRLAFLTNPSFTFGVVGILVTLVLWEMMLRVGVINPKLMPSPIVVFQSALQLVISGELFKHAAASIARALTGLVVGSAIGIMFGILTGRYKIFGYLTEPIAQLFRSIPAIAFVPLAIVWFGLGERATLFLVTFGVFFPVWINTLTGVKNVRPVYIRAARSLGVTNTQLLWRLIFPAALQYIISGVRISVAIAYIMLVAAEMAGARIGLGQMIQESHLVFRVDKMLVGIVMLGILGFASDRLFMFIVHKVFPWYGAEQA
jgi:ABC-type nitrate/sulfonate/bicarbonate transport system permease component